MIIDAYATDTVPSHEVRRRANEALANAGEPMSEVTYDALRKRLAEAEEELSIWKSVFPDIAPERVMPDRSLLHAEIGKLRAESEKLAASNHAYLSNYQEAIGEIERLKAGGCARDQTTTQYCAEAVALQSENVRLKDAIHDLAKHISRWDWWSLKPETHALVGEKE
jgi:hypothetical protein